MSTPRWLRQTRKDRTAAPLRLYTAVADEVRHQSYRLDHLDAVNQHINAKVELVQTWDPIKAALKRHMARRT